MSASRSEVLEQTRLTLEKQLRCWAEKNKVLKLGEQLNFDLRIVRGTPTVLGRVVDESREAERKALLPPDEPSSYGSQTIWRLATEDWEKLAVLQWDENQARFLALLRELGNGPLYTSELAALGIEWSVGFVRRFNTVLKQAKDYYPRRESGAYYKLCQLGVGTGNYAIMKHQNCRNSEA